MSGPIAMTGAEARLVKRIAHARLTESIGRKHVSRMTGVGFWASALPELRGAAGDSRLAHEARQTVARFVEGVEADALFVDGAPLKIPAAMHRAVGEGSR